MLKNFQKNFKKFKFLLKKLLKRVTLITEKIFIATGNCEVTPYQILEEAPCPLRLESLKVTNLKGKCYQTIAKTCDIKMLNTITGTIKIFR